MSKKSKGTSLVRWDEQLAKDAKLATAVEAGVGAGNFVGTRGGVLSIDGSPIPGNKLPVVILDHIAVNAFYEGKFDPDTPASPVCYALTHVKTDGTMPDMVPHEKCEDQQAPACEGCDWNKFGSADTGRGKACKNSRRLAVIHADSLKLDPAGIKKAPVRFINVPVTSIRGWAGYVRTLSEVLKRPPYAVITEISLVPDAETTFKMVFEPRDKITTPALLGALKERNTAMAEEIMFPYADNTTREVKGKGGVRKVVRKKPVVSKKGGKKESGRAARF